MPNTSYGTLMRNGVNYSHDTAESISYDNTSSGLTSTNTQDAINEIKNDIPTTLSQLSEDTTHRVVTDTEKTTWNNKSDLTLGTTSSTAAAGNHTHNTTIAADSGTSTLSMAANTKYKLTAGGKSVIFTTPPDNSASYTGTGLISIDSNNVISTTAEVNQNAFSNIVVGSTTVAADTKTDSVTYASSGILTITGDATNDKITFGVSTGTTSATAAAGNHTHSAATTAAAGFMAAADKTKLNGIATGAEVNQNAFSNILVGSTTVAADAKTDTVEYAASGILTITGDATNDKVTFGVATGTTSATAAAGNHTHGLSIAADSGTSSLTMAANTKYKLTAGGKTYIFTTPPDSNTTYTGTGLISIDSSNVISTTAEVNQNAFSNIKIGSTTVAADAKMDTVEYAASGILTITGDATNDKITFGVATGTTSATAAAGNHTHSAATTAAAGFMAAADKTKLNGIATGAEVNQNAFSNIKIGSTTVAANAKMDTVEYASSGILTITGDATNDKVTFGVATGTTSATAAAGNHNHGNTTIAADSGTSSLTMAANTKYKITAAGKSYIFTTPPDTNTKVTSVDNHYAPTSASGEDISASATGATAAWSIDVVKGVTLNTDGKGHVTGMTVTSGKIPANPNTDTKVKINNTNPTSGTWYYPTWYTATSGTGEVNSNDGFRYYSLQGTSAAAGRTVLSIGNATATGTAGNKYGEIWIYAEKKGYVALKATAASTATRNVTFPDKAGTIALTSDLDWSGPESVNTSTSATIPVCREILIIGEIADATYSGLYVTIHIPYAFLTTTSRDFRGGWSQASSYGGAIYFRAGKTNDGKVLVSLYKGYLNNIETTNYCSGNVYYR